MADEAVKAEAKDTAEKLEGVASEAPKAETAAQAVKSEPAKAGQSAREAKASAARPAARKIEKIVAARKPKTIRKSKSVRKLVATAAIAAAAVKPVRAGLKQVKGANEMNKQTNQKVDAGLFAADQFKNVFGDVNARAKAAAERSAKVAEELADLTRGNVEAFVASSKIAAKGVESMSQEAAEYGRKAFEEASATLKNLAEVKSATDFFKLQGDYARAAFDSAVAESARFSETVLKLAGEVAEPITSRYTVAAERVKTLAA